MDVILIYLILVFLILLFYYNTVSCITCIKELLKKMNNVNEKQEISANIWMSLIFCNMFFLLIDGIIIYVIGRETFF
jgi:uncharacterized membrane protein